MNEPLVTIMPTAGGFGRAIGAAVAEPTRMICWEVGDACPDCGQPPDRMVLCEYVDQSVTQRWYGKGCTRHEAAQ